MLRRCEFLRLIRRYPRGAPITARILHFLPQRQAVPGSGEFPRGVPDGAITEDRLRTVGKGFKSSIQAQLERALVSGGQGLAFYAFDLLWRDSLDLRRRPLLERKAELARLLRRPPERLILLESVSPAAAAPSSIGLALGGLARFARTFLCTMEGERQLTFGG